MPPDCFCTHSSANAHRDPAPRLMERPFIRTQVVREMHAIVLHKVARVIRHGVSGEIALRAHDRPLHVAQPTRGDPLPL